MTPKWIPSLIPLVPLVPLIPIILIFTIIKSPAYAAETTAETTTGTTETSTPYKVINDSHEGAKILVEDNRVVCTTKSNHKISISEPFRTPSMDWRPSNPILCSWSLDNQYVAIFIPHPRVTIVSIVNLTNNFLLQEEFPKNRTYPDWYQDVYATSDIPEEWANNQLSIETTVTLKNKEKRILKRILSIQGGKFTILPINTIKRSNQKTSQIQTKPAPKEKEKEKKYSQEW